MLETEKQRRWWFATHPEFSWSRKGPGSARQLQEKGSADKVHPEGSERSQSARGPVIEFLKSLKRILGTDGDVRDSISRYLLEHRPSGHISTVRRPRLPTPEEFYRGPGAMIRESLRALDAFSARHPLAIDEEYVKASRGLWKEFQKRMAEPGPGEWVLVARSPVGLEHQSRMSGSPIIKKDGKYHIYEYKLNGVYFDDRGKEKGEEILIEHKGRLEHLFDKNNDMNPWVKDPMQFYREALGQVKAAKGRKVIWRVGENQVEAVKKALRDVQGIKIEP